MMLGGNKQTVEHEAPEADAKMLFRGSVWWVEE